MKTINWKLLFGLSLFAAFMAFGTVFFISSKIEPFCWLAIFLICAWMIAKNAPGKFFLHGFLLALINCIWVTGAHVFLYSAYMEHHPEMAAMNSKMPLPTHPRVMMLITGPIIGIISGLVQGLFAFVAAKIAKRK